MFFAGQFFIQKCVSGAGVFISAAILAIAAFPDQATPGEVADTILIDLALIYVGLIMTLGLIAAYFMSRFPIKEADHHARIARMRGLTDTQ